MPSVVPGGAFSKGLERNAMNATNIPATVAKIVQVYGDISNCATRSRCSVHNEPSDKTSAHSISEPPWPAHIEPTR
ncbi:unannotated protein [freshwater metagenome]|uniref:Unannotated protein n=1 Tax=freshwater metagenome TaxID=449393 RepID=A0A6J5ZFD7_9ZZZZ